MEKIKLLTNSFCIPCCLRGSEGSISGCSTEVLQSSDEIKSLFVTLDFVFVIARNDGWKSCSSRGRF